MNIAVSGGLPATGKTYTGRAGSEEDRMPDPKSNTGESVDSSRMLGRLECIIDRCDEMELAGNNDVSDWKSTCRAMRSDAKDIIKLLTSNNSITGGR